jgi:formyl-CoA transferase
MHTVVPRMLGTPGAIRSPGGALGEHNREVYVSELGLDCDEVQRLQAAGVI